MPPPHSSAFRNVVALCIATIAISNTASAQTSYSIDFANGVSCDIKVTAYVDVIGNNCASPTSVGSQFLSSGNTTNFSFTVPSGYEFCYYLLTADPNTGGPYYQTTGGNPCAWNFSGVDLCNTGGMTPISGKGNCTSARFSQ